MKKFSLLLLFALLAVAAGAQERNKRLTIEVASVAGDYLGGQPVLLMQTDFEVSYGQLLLDDDGRCALNVYPGNHQLTIERDGFETLVHTFVVADDATQLTVSLQLREKTRQPFALSATTRHDAFTGQTDVELSWNTEAPAFFDDFESYEPFATQFGEWTGIDADMAAAAPLLGSYPNRGVMQYAQIINPLTVEPTWWYDYPILRPYSGQQYVGFTRTSTGVANDDWLISPTVTPGTENVLQFMGKAADQFTERFMVYVTTNTDAPTQADFVRIDLDNYETADYREWRQYSYDLSAYAGQPIKFAIRYISDYNRYRSFMLMVDDVFVGQPAAKALARRSPANPNEKFRVLLDGQPSGTTYNYSFTLRDVSAGEHTVGVQAVYLQSESEPATISLTLPGADHYACLRLRVTANSILSPDGQQVQLLSLDDGGEYTVEVEGDVAEIASLPKGRYVVSIAEGAFEAWQQTVTLEADTELAVALADHIVAPYNITAATTDDGLTLRWNQELLFADSFEDYPDFASGSFGDWITVDRDQMPVYPIALGSQTNIVSFPGSGSAYNPMPVAPMVFNPWHTTPAMLPTDQAIAAPTGDKTVIFFSPQRGRADKWLISPLLDIRDGYQLQVTAKGYDSMYPESMEFCVSTDGSTRPEDFTAISKVDPVSSGQWSLYLTDLADYAGMQVRLAIHYTSYDAFLMQVDDFTVGPESGQGEFVDYGNVVRFDIYLDGQLVGQSTAPTYTFASLPAGDHVVGIVAIYADGQSSMAEYTVTATSAIATVSLPRQSAAACFDLSGRSLAGAAAARGLYIVRQNGQTRKLIK